MEAMITPLLGLVVVLSVGIPVLFIVSVRFVAYRLAGRPETLQVPAADVFPVPRFSSRWQAVRTLTLVTVLGIGTGIMLLRYVYGIGEVTNLSNRFPWGLWIGFDVMGGVALAAGAIAGTFTGSTIR